MPKTTKRERQRQNREARREAMRDAERRRRRMRTARNVGIAVVVLVVVVAILQLTRGDDDSSTNASSASAVTCSNRKPSTPVRTDTYEAAPELSIDPARTYEARMHTSCGDIPIELDAAQAPQTVNSFLFLVQREFYNGTKFHRIVTDFVDQGGDPKGDGTGGPGYQLPDEPPAEPYKVGDVAMANSGPGTSGSQFFLVVSKKGADTLNAQGTPGLYSILGHMTDAGLKVAKKINTFGSADSAGTPTRDIYVFDIGIVFGDSTAETTTTTPPETTAAP